MINSLSRPFLARAHRPLSRCTGLTTTDRISIRRPNPTIQHTRRAACSKSSNPTCPSKAEPSTCHSKSTASTCPSKSNPSPPITSLAFWSSPPTWRRAGVNTLRCLVGCTAGDFSAMFYLQACHPELGMGTIMAMSMTSGILTSLGLETTLLHFGRDALPWVPAAKTAAGMSMISMLTMEAAENAVDWQLTGGVVDVWEPAFWGAAVVGAAAGFMAPLPWNYGRLRRYGKACH